MLEQAGSLDERNLWTAEFLDPDGHRLALVMELRPASRPDGQPTSNDWSAKAA
jgi:hypothetical protein